MSGPRKLVRVITWIVAIVAIIILALLLVSTIAPQFINVWDMIDFIFASGG